jgi:fibronectin type III domain protein
MKNILNHAMRTTTLPNPETQARIQQVKLGVDWRAELFRLARPHRGTGVPGNAHAEKPGSLRWWFRWRMTSRSCWGRRCKLYPSQPVASVTRSVEDLRGFQKVCLQPGETKEVTFPITTEDLKFHNSELEYDWEPGEFTIPIGGNSSQLKSASVSWNKEALPTPPQ